MVNPSEISKRASEFDQYADDYLRLHKENIAVSGEEPEYFSKYKIAEVSRCFEQKKPASVLDFGSGIGSSMPHFQHYFPNARLICSDVSKRSLDIAMSRFPEMGEPLLISNETIDLPNAVIDLTFTACTFHHIPEHEHLHWLKELRRVTKPGGVLTLFEHNPLNPLTVRAVNTCPFDVNAKLLRADSLRQTILRAGWQGVVVRYHVFFPHFLSFARPLERKLSWLPIGAQYSIVAFA